jgi:hypothetical protein
MSSAQLCLVLIGNLSQVAYQRPVRHAALVWYTGGDYDNFYTLERSIKNVRSVLVTGRSVPLHASGSIDSAASFFLLRTVGQPRTI